MSLPGTYIHLKKNGSDAEVIVPFPDPFGFTCTQTWFYPLKELFDGLKGIIQETAEGTGGVGAIVSGGIEAISMGMRLFGTQLFNTAFQARAWEKEEPVSLGVNLKFFFGMNDKWNGKDEVYNPIIKLMGSSVPQKGSAKIDLITAPGPNAFDVYGFYANSLFSFMKPDALGKKVTEAQSASQVLKNENTEIKLPKANDNAPANLWNLSVGYSVDGTKIEIPFFKLSNLIMVTSGFTFSPEVDENGYPINGTFKADLSSQTLILSSDFYGQDLYIKGNTK